jgi:hypothetical protein
MVAGSRSDQAAIAILGVALVLATFSSFCTDNDSSSSGNLAFLVRVSRSHISPIKNKLLDTMLSFQFYLAAQVVRSLRSRKICLWWRSRVLSTFSFNSNDYISMYHIGYLRVLGLGVLVDNNVPVNAIRFI